MTALRDKLLARLEPVVEALGYELVELEYGQFGQERVLRLYIDRAGGVTLDDCERVSHQVSGVLDVDDPIEHAYSLEVSSPGFDRPLRKPVHYDRFTGARVKIELKVPLENRRRFTGLLRGRNGEAIVLEVDGREYVLRLADIEKARLAPL